jgi:hypothetical protein
MSNERTLKKIFNTKPEGRRSVGRTKLRWEDGVVQDTRVLGANSWKKAALNRDEWAKLLKGQAPPRTVGTMMMMMKIIRTQ